MTTQAGAPDEGRASFVASRFVRGAIGLACLSPYFAWRGAATPVDAAVALCLAAPLAAAVLAGIPGRLPAARAISGAASAGLAAAALVSLGASAWPVLLLVLAEPLEAWLAGRGRDALTPALGASLALAAAALVSGPIGGPARTAGPGEIAAAFLVLWALGQLAVALGRSRGQQQAGEASRIPMVDAALLEAACDLVTWHDGQGDVLEASAGASRLVRVAPNALRGGGLLGRVHVSDRPAYLKALSEVANGAEPRTVEYRLHAGATVEGWRDGKDVGTGGARVVWVEMRAQRIEGGGGRRPSVVALIRDTSAHHRQATEAEKARNEAERADEMKGRFLATVSHELRTPLNAIIGFSELMAVDHPYVLTEERRKEYALIIRNSGHHLLEIVNTLLDMSKIETGNFHVLPEPFNVRELALSCCDLMQLKAEEARIEIRRAIEADLPEIIADRRACRQILINLLSNAVKFTPAGGAVTVSLTRGGNAVVLAVADDGIGIPEADLPRLGDPFFQSGDIHRRHHEGTGLGLSVVRGLVGLHGGTLSIESGSGVGTTVTVTLPIDGGADQRAAKPVTIHTLPRMPARGPERKIA